MILRTVDLSRVGYLGLALSAAGAAATLALGRGSAFGVLLGGAFMFVNYHLIRMLVSRLIAPDSSGGTALALLLAKSALLLLLMVGVFGQLPIAPMSFAAGISTIPLAVVLEAVWLGTPVGPSDETEGG